MKRVKEVPAQVIATIKSEHERAMDSVLQQYKHFCTLPVRPARMRVLRVQEDTEELEQVIVPATAIYLKPNGFLGKDYLNRDALTYTVAGNRIPFPFGHIYRSSGHVCLGNIFVPSKVSRFCPQQPLETLFLHNDRNLGHGNAFLSIGEPQVQKIRKILEDYQIPLSVDADHGLKAGQNLLIEDSIWLIGADVYKQAETLQQALHCMEQIYQIVFNTKTSQKKE